MVVETLLSGFLLTSVRLFTRWESICGMKAVACRDLYILAQAALRHMILFRNRAILGVIELGLQLDRGRLTPLTEGASLARRQCLFLTFVPIAWLDRRWLFVAEDSCSVHPASYPI